MTIPPRRFGQDECHAKQLLARKQELLQRLQHVSVARERDVIERQPKQIDATLELLEALVAGQRSTKSP